MKKALYIISILLIISLYFKFSQKNSMFCKSIKPLSPETEKNETQKNALNIYDIEKLSWKLDVFRPLEKPIIVKKQNPKRNTNKKVVKKERKVYPPSLRLTGILKSPSGNMAIVNRKIVKKGDYISGSKIEKIGENYIEVIKSKKRFYFYLKR